MRWESLFADLEGQLEAAAVAELEAEVSDRTRRETARLRLVDRVRPSAGRPVALCVDGAGWVRGTLTRVGADWLLLAEAPGRDALVPAARLLRVQGLGPRSAEPGSEGRVAGRLDLRSALRGLARDRAAVQAVLADGTGVSGTVDRVGSDFLEVARHADGEARRSAAVRDVEVLPLAGLALVRSS